MKEYKIEVVIDEKGTIVAETKGMHGKICAKELDKILEGIEGEKKIKNTLEYYKSPPLRQAIRQG